MGRKKSRILDAVHETAADLHKLGFIDMRAMASNNALCTTGWMFCGVFRSLNQFCTKSIFRRKRDKKKGLTENP
jgi:hypothetical protein